MFKKIKEFLFGKPKKEKKPLYKIKEEQKRTNARNKRKRKNKSSKK